MGEEMNWKIIESAVKSYMLQYAPNGLYEYFVFQMHFA